MDYSTLFLTIFMIFSCTCSALFIQDFTRWRYLPRGPAPLPFIGNLLHLRKTTTWTKFSEWSGKYGGIYTVWLGRQPALIISDPAIAALLLERRGNKYASRPRSIMFGEVYSKLTSIIVLPYGKKWSLRRRMLNRALKPADLPTYRPRQSAEATKLAAHMLLEPERWESSIDRFTASTIFTMTYGRRGMLCRFLSNIYSKLVTPDMGS